MLLGALITVGVAAGPVHVDLQRGSADPGTSPDPSVWATEPGIPPPPPSPEPVDVEAEAEAAADAVDVEDWDRLADCESGDWDAEGEPRTDTARWDYGLAFDHGDHFQGGLNFHPDTWESYRDSGMPSHAGRATRAEEIEIAEQVLDDQGWNAWPTCSDMLHLDE